MSVNFFDNRIKKIQKEYDKLQKDLVSPEKFSATQKLKQASQRLNELLEILSKSKELNKFGTQLKETQELAEKEQGRELKNLALEEAKTLKAKIKKLEEELEFALIPQDPRDKKDVILEIRAAAGGDEASLFVGDLLRMYKRYTERKGFKYAEMEKSTIGIGGVKEAILSIKGQDVFERLKYEMGVHRVQRIPETEKSGRIHTSTVTVAVLAEVKEKEFEIDPKDLRIDVFHASGSGGQNVNKVATAIRITHLPTGIAVSCQDERYQGRNREKAIQILRSRLSSVEEEKREKKERERRRSQIGTGDRAEKIRTYNFPQDRITDHRIKRSFHNINQILDGDLDSIIDELIKEDKKRKLELVKKD